MAIGEPDIELGLTTQSAAVNGQPPLVSPGLKRSGRQRSSTFQTVQTTVSHITSFPLQVYRRFTQRPVEEAVSPLCNSDVTARDEFLLLLLGTNGAENGLPPPCLWYAKFLECRFGIAWPRLIRPALRGVQDFTNEPQAGEIGLAYNFLAVAAKSLQPREGDALPLAMVDIVDQLFNGRFIKEQRARSQDDQDNRIVEERDGEQSDGERAIPNQLVFAAIGWLTMLFDPSPTQPPNELTIRNPRGSSFRREPLRTRRTFISYRQQGFENYDQPLYLFLKRFGNLIPEIKVDLLGEAELIAVSYVCFAMLDKVTEVKIEWVNSLSLHLEFDNNRRVLKMFKFPSYCKLMYEGRDSTLLSRIYKDHGSFIREHGLEDEVEDRSKEYFREVLLSYRLIFGQDKASWKNFSQKSPTWEKSWACSDAQSDDADPMLVTLCGSSWKSRDSFEIYQAIDAEDISPYYYPDTDFPFLGRRILNLQAFVRGRNPHNWMALWHDRRNVAFFWTFWAVIFIGGGTIFLAFLSLAFQIWGSISAQWQVDLSSTAPATPT